MITDIEQLERLLEQATARPWRFAAEHMIDISTLPYARFWLAGRIRERRAALDALRSGK